jgi:hypothetical protein
MHAATRALDHPGQEHSICASICLLAQLNKSPTSPPLTPSPSQTTHLALLIRLYKGVSNTRFWCLTREDNAPTNFEGGYDNHQGLQEGSSRQGWLPPTRGAS